MSLYPFVPENTNCISRIPQSCTHLGHVSGLSLSMARECFIVRRWCGQINHLIHKCDVFAQEPPTIVCGALNELCMLNKLGAMGLVWWR